MDPQVAAHYEVDLTELDRLERQIVDDYAPEDWGLGRYAGISDVSQRAVASDLLISLSEGAKTALLDLAIATRRYADLLGPNGRTMPGPETTLNDRVDLAQMEATSTECFRALGSALDCLCGLCVLITGVPLSVQRAEGSWLLRRPRGPSAPERQEQVWRQIEGVVVQEADIPQPGWLAWALESRNAVVHRGQLLRLWLNRPGHRPGTPRVLVHTQTPPQYLMRMEEHLRRRPWLPDMHALTTGRDFHELWLAEPAQITLAYLQRRVTEVANTVAAILNTNWDAMKSFEWPVAAWQLQAREDGWRIELASQFGGFDPGYEAPPPAQVRMHADSAKRPALAERLRKVSKGSSRDPAGGDEWAADG